MSVCLSVTYFGHFHENTFVRLVTINGENSEKDILNFFKTIEHFVDSNNMIETISNSPSDC